MKGSKFIDRATVEKCIEPGITRREPVFTCVAGPRSGKQKAVAALSEALSKRRPGDKA